MEKKTKYLIILTILLCGCSRQRSASCSRFDGEDSLTLNLTAENDVLKTVEVVEMYDIPEHLLANPQFYSDLLKQFDETCHMEENRLFRKYGLFLDQEYSFSKTVSELERERYHCE